MKTSIESLEGNQKKVTVELDPKEVDDRINKQYKDFAYRYNFPGFRKGKAPRPVVDNALGPNAVVATVTEDVLNSSYPLALDEHDLVAIGQPQFEESDVMVQQGKPFSFYFTVETRPELALSSFEPVAVELPSTEPTEEEIDAQIEEFRNYYYEFEDAAASKKVEDKGFVELAMKVTNAQGEPIESLSTESRIYELGAGLFPASLDKALVGMKKGEAKTIEIDMSEPSMMTQNLGESGTAKFEVEVKQVKKRVLPELTDEWVKEKAFFDTVAELRERMASQIKNQKEQLMPRVRESEALYSLQERLEGEIPPVMLEAQETELLQNFFNQLQQSGMSFDMFLAANGMNPDSFKDDLKHQAEDIVRQDLALDAWARNAKMVISPEEISEEFAKSGADDPLALEEEWRRNGRIPALRQSMLRAKALDQIIEGLQVTELAPGEKLKSRGFNNENKSDKKSGKKGSKKPESGSKSAEKKADGGKEAPAEEKAKKTSAKKKAEKAEGEEA